jgi:ArsR family transcriptional regulator
MPSAPKGSVDLMFRAFSDPTRLRVLHLLRGGELCVGDLIQILEVAQPTASRHLSYLRRAGLVSARKNGGWSFYSLVPARNEFHARLLDCLASCFREVPEIARDVERARRLRARGGCCPR